MLPVGLQGGCRELGLRKMKMALWNEQQYQDPCYVARGLHYLMGDK